MESKPSSAIPEAVCERCGSFETLEIGGEFLCGDCIATAGCGCAGHGENKN